MSARNVRSSAPGYLRRAPYRQLLLQLEDVGCDWSSTRTHLVIDGFTYLHEDCERDPRKVAGHIERILKSGQIRSNGRGGFPAGVVEIQAGGSYGGLPHQLYTRGGQHISERSS